MTPSNFPSTGMVVSWDSVSLKSFSREPSSMYQQQSLFDYDEDEPEEDEDFEDEEEDEWEDIDDDEDESEGYDFHFHM